MQNKVRYLSLFCVFCFIISAVFMLSGCGSGKNSAADDKVMFSVLLRDSERGTHYQFDIKRSECSATQASVLDRLENSGMRIAVSVSKSPDQMTDNERQKLISAIIEEYRRIENEENKNNGSTVTPEDPTPGMDPMKEPVTLSLSDAESGATYSFTFDASELSDEDKALITAQIESGTLIMDIQEDPAEMTEIQKQDLLAKIISILSYVPPEPIATVLIDAGHGFANSEGVIDKGTGHGSPYYDLTGKYESDLNLAIALCLKEKLIDAGFAVIMIRESEVFETLGINDRVRRINALGADIMISVHGNAAGATASGARVYWNRKNRHAEICEAYAQTVTDAINSVEGTTLVEAKMYEGDYAVVRDVHIPSVLVETCFLTNQADAQMASDPIWVERMADALCLGLQNQYAS